MAATNTGAQFKYNLAGRTSGIIRSFIIGDSKTVTIGDFVHLESGFIDIASATERILGVVIGIVDRDGINMDQSNVTKEGTWTTSTHTYVTDSDNTTSEQARVLVDVDPFSVWSCEPDCTIGTSPGSNLAGYTTEILDEDELDEDSAHATNAQQLFIWGVDPEDSARALVSIAEHQAFH